MRKILSLCAVLSYISMPVFGSVIISFSDGGTFDQAGVGESMALTDGSYNFNLTTVDIIDVHGYSATTNSIIKTSISTANEFGINSGGSAYGDPSTTSFNDGEAWVAAFDQDVVLDSINLRGIDPGDSLVLTIFDGSNEGTGTVMTLTNQNGNIVNKIITAGTNFMLQVGSTSGAVRFNTITVTAIPEPCTVGLFGCVAVGALLARRWVC